MADRGEAEDLTQEVFLKALRQGARFCEVRNRRAWLFEVARNALTDRLRLKRDLVDLPEDLPELREEPPPVDALADCLPAPWRPCPRRSARPYRCDLEGMTRPTSPGSRA
jgi:RNA polymerase sigma-70 factor (ECF subfamily)